MCVIAHAQNKILFKNRSDYCWGCTKSRLPHSLEKVAPILVLQFENDPLFCLQNTDFLAQNDPFFMVKH